MAQHGLTEDDYAAVSAWATYEGFSDAERAALEYTEKFATDHLAIDDELFSRLRRHFRDDEIFEISLCVGTWLMMGRITMVMGVSPSCPIRLEFAEKE